MIYLTSSFDLKNQDYRFLFKEMTKNICFKTNTTFPTFSYKRHFFRLNHMDLEEMEKELHLPSNMYLYLIMICLC